MRVRPSSDTGSSSTCLGRATLCRNTTAIEPLDGSGDGGDCSVVYAARQSYYESLLEQHVAVGQCSRSLPEHFQQSLSGRYIQRRALLQPGLAGGELDGKRHARLVAACTAVRPRQ